MGGYRSVTVTPGSATLVDVTRERDRRDLGGHAHDPPESRARRSRSTAGSPRAHGQVQTPSLLSITTTATFPAGPPTDSLTVTAEFGQLEARTTWQAS